MLHPASDGGGGAVELLVCEVIGGGDEIKV
jgi:hypothetical protein